MRTGFVTADTSEGKSNTCTSQPEVMLKSSWPRGELSTGIGDAAQIKYQQARLHHWNEVARKLETWTGWGAYYHRRLIEIYQSLISSGWFTPWRNKRRAGARRRCL